MAKVIVIRHCNDCPHNDECEHGKMCCNHYSTIQEVAYKRLCDASKNMAHLDYEDSRPISIPDWCLLEDFTAEMNEWGADFIIHLGDNIDSHGTATSGTWDYFQEYRDEATAPQYDTFGNHDYVVLGSDEAWKTKTGNSDIYYSVMFGVSYE